MGFASIVVFHQMAAISQMKLIFLGLCSLTLVSLVINTNIAFTVREAVKPNKLAMVVHDEVQHVFSQFKGLHKDFNLSFMNKSLPAGATYRSFDKTKHSGSYPQKLDNMDESPFLFHKNFSPSFVLGEGRTKPVNIVIGIPSVKREAADYLIETLQSLFSQVYPVNEDQIAIVVFIAESDRNYTEHRLQKLYKAFTSEVDSGLLQAITPPENFYPAFDALPETLGDSRNRTKWRSKEVLDTAYLMFICRNMAKYYLMLEDDVLALKGYFESVKSFSTVKENDDYVFLSLSMFNSIGKLFRSSTIPKWTSYLMTFFGEKPIDWLMFDYIRLVSCNPSMNVDTCERVVAEMRPQYRLGLFQHIGKRSSLTGKAQLIEDQKFSFQSPLSNPHHNVDAQVSTTFKAEDNSNAELLYKDSGGMNSHFLVSQSSLNDHLSIQFEKLVDVEKILVKTGNGFTDKRRYCKSCAVLETQANHTSSYFLCTSADSQGNLECHPQHKISGFRIRNKVAMESPVWFHVLFVKTRY